MSRDKCEGRRDMDCEAVGSNMTPYEEKKLKISTCPYNEMSCFSLWSSSHQEENFFPAVDQKEAGRCI